jgi:hypothetical protein
VAGTSGSDEAAGPGSRIDQLLKADMKVIESAAEALARAQDESSRTRLQDEYVKIRTELAAIGTPDPRAKGQDWTFLNWARVIATALLIVVLAAVAVIGVMTKATSDVAQYVSLLSGLVGIGLGWLFGNVVRPDGMDFSQQTKRGAKRQHEKASPLAE